MVPSGSLKSNHSVQIIHTFTKRLKFARVEVIQEAEKSPFHFLDIWYICEKRVLDWCCLGPFCFASWRFGFFFYYSEEIKQLDKMITLLPLQIWDVESFDNRAVKVKSISNAPFKSIDHKVVLRIKNTVWQFNAAKEGLQQSAFPLIVRSTVCM